MLENEWLWLTLAVRRIGAPDAERRLQLAWREGTLELRGVPSTIPETHEFAEIPAYETVRLWLDCRHNRLLRGSRKRHATAYDRVQARRVDVEPLVQETRGGQATAAPAPNQAPSNVASAAKTTVNDAGRAGGIESGVKRREGRKWVSHARKHARAAYKRNQGASNVEIAKAIEDNWKLKRVTCPERKTLERFVSELRKSGELLPRRASHGT
jgi:hypothetical protein